MAMVVISCYADGLCIMAASWLGSLIIVFIAARRRCPLVIGVMVIVPIPIDWGNSFLVPASWRLWLVYVCVCFHEGPSPTTK